MSSREEKIPFKPLGSHLRRLRERQQETLADASSAVEIDVNQLIEIEKGTTRPSEDILLLLISHFATKEDEAGKLWKMAGYANGDELSDVMRDEETANILMGLDENRIAYTDAVHVVTNNYGLVINFLQSSGQYNKPQIAARVGMSKEYAVHMLAILKRALEQEPGLPKTLPYSSNQSTKNNPDSK